MYKKVKLYTFEDQYVLLKDCPDFLFCELWICDQTEQLGPLYLKKEECLRLARELVRSAEELDSE